MKDNRNNIKMIIYVSDLALYKRGINEWIELDLMKPQEAKRKYDDFQKEREEHALFISDTSMTYNVGINELDNIDFIIYMADIFFSNWSEEQLHVFSDLVTEGDYEWTKGAEIVDNYDYTIIEHEEQGKEEECVGRYYTEYLELPDNIEQYFNYENYGRDILLHNENITKEDYTIIIVKTNSHGDGSRSQIK